MAIMNSWNGAEGETISLIRARVSGNRREARPLQQHSDAIA